MNTDRLPFDPIQRSSSFNLPGGCSVSRQGWLLEFPISLKFILYDKPLCYPRNVHEPVAYRSLVWKDDQVMLSLSDNGQGFKPAAPPGKGLGLRSMRERVEAIGGHFKLTSHLETGTQVMVCCKNSSPNKKLGEK